MPDLSIALCLRDDEHDLPEMAQAALEVARVLVAEHGAGEWRDATRVHSVDNPREKAWVRGDLEASERLRFELLALDERSRDNTLSVLSILHGKVPQLRSVQELEPGTAVREAARHATGRVWLLVDGPFDPEHGLWAARQVFCGDPAALIPGEVLALGRGLGQATLGWLRGGLVSAQFEVERMLAAQGRKPAWSPPTQRRLRDRAHLQLRRRMGRLGLGLLDRPL
ncbi:hypothetical protein G6O69_05585 [Pseudenhygromyxa sp. WMMC2535]|uniref:hypothetical protein n=1 Tax=Pseudenhygromyxa sp. WMMC2535 TaxID=2712867 RepID=UPI001556A210|nr:hypothetical protein [Pseudenhygromyxa sp. WMMC2535]NVB37293.1 hypothetical protein [Pseudenhygromyxa sp. WMMC2535]